MILLDTHIWIWWVHDSPQLPPWMRQTLMQRQHEGIAIASISCLEVSRLITLQRLKVSLPIEDWFEAALSYPDIRVIDLSWPICVDAYRLPEEFHSDPADRIIVATARHLDVPLMTQDQRILNYPHVKLATPFS